MKRNRYAPAPGSLEWAVTVELIRLYSWRDRFLSIVGVAGLCRYRETWIAERAS